MSRLVYSVSSLVHYLKESIDNDMNVQSVLIKGEISNFTNHRSGHWYFTLKDKKSKLSCVMFSSYASRCKILPKEGMQVILTASLSVYEAQGTCQLYVTQVQADGIGDLYLQYEQLKEKLAEEGLFDPTHKKPLPTYPMRIGIISAREGAALQDIYTTLRRRWPMAELHFFPSLVQGKDAPAAMIKILENIDAQELDVVLLARGGGAIEDLWCFNDEGLARTIYAMKTVIVSGVGHETDTTLVDYVSDARAPTPTAAAELITPDKEEVAQNLANQKARMVQCIHRQLQEANLHMQQLHAHRYMREPLSYIQEANMSLALHAKELGIIHVRMNKERSQLALHFQQMTTQFSMIEKNASKHLQEKRQHFLHAMQQYKTLQKQQFSHHVSLLDAYSPLKILRRGYGVVYQQHHIVKSIHEIHDEQIEIRLQDGILHTRVDHKEEF